MNKIKILLPFFSFFVVFIINFTFIVFIYNSWNDSMQKYLPLQKEISSLKSNLAKSHLWLEEAMAGDKEVDIKKDVMIPLENRSYHAYVELSEKVLTTQEDKKYLIQLHHLQNSLNSLLIHTKKRWTNIEEYGVGSDEDQKFDAEFNAILKMADILSLDIESKINTEIENQDSYFYLIIILFLLINISILIAIVFYIRRQKAYELSLFESNEKSFVTLSSIGDAVITTDAHGCVTFMNKTTEKLTEYTNEEAQGLPIDKVLDLYDIKTGEKIQTSIDDVLYNNLIKLISNGTLLKSKSGKEYIVSDSASPLKTKAGEIFGTVLVFQDDTKRHKMNEKINYQYNILNTVLNTTPDLIFYKDYLNHNGKYLGCNKAFEAFVGKSNIEIVNHTDIELFGEEIGEFFRKKDREMLTKNETIINEEWVTYPDGLEVLLSTAKTPYLNEEGQIIGVMGVSRDITQGYELNKQLQSSHDLLDKLSNNIPGGLYQYRLHPDGRSSFPYASIGIEKIYELTAKELMYDGQAVFDVIHPDDVPIVYGAMMKSAETMELLNVEYRVQLPKKGLRWLWGHAKPEILEDGSILFHAFVEDITELKEKDEMLINQSRQAAMGEMIGMIAHQWRQPISAIAMDANNMLLDIEFGNFNTGEATKFAHSINEQTQHLSKTIDDFRNFFKPDKVISKVNIRDIFNQTLSIIKASLKNNNIELNVSYQTEKEVDAFPRELMQVFVNIINNSQDALISNNKYNPTINVEVYEDDKYLNIKICDNGGGIDADILPKVFDPYFSTKDEKTGTGLGLYMSKMIIEKHLNGRIEASNTEKGACFIISLLKEKELNNTKNLNEY